MCWITFDGCDLALSLPFGTNHQARTLGYSGVLGGHSMPQETDDGVFNRVFLNSSLNDTTAVRTSDPVIPHPSFPAATRWSAVGRRRPLTAMWCWHWALRTGLITRSRIIPYQTGPSRGICHEYAGAQVRSGYQVLWPKRNLPVGSTSTNIRLTVARINFSKRAALPPGPRVPELSSQSL